MATTLTTKPLDWFKPDPGNPRKSLPIEELRELRDSLIKKQLVPLFAKPEGTIIDGWRRWSAAKLDGKPERLDVIITDEPLNAAQIREIQLVTSLHRADLTPYEQFLGCRDWLAMNAGATAKDLAARIDRDPSMLTRILSLSRCIPEVQAAAADGRLGPSEWYAIAKVADVEQVALLAAKLAGASRDQLEQFQRKVAGGTPQAVKLSRYKIALSGGKTVTLAGQALSLDDAIETLEEVLKAARKARAEALDAKTFVQVMRDKAKAGR